MSKVSFFVVCDFVYFYIANSLSQIYLFNIINPYRGYFLLKCLKDYQNVYKFVLEIVLCMLKFDAQF